jgi:hypothetical protein
VLLALHDDDDARRLADILQLPSHQFDHLTGRFPTAGANDVFDMFQDQIAFARRWFDPEPQKKVAGIVGDTVARERDARVDVPIGVPVPDVECRRKDRLVVLLGPAGANDLWREASPQVVFPDRQEIVAVDIDAWLVGGFQEGVAFIQLRDGRKELLDALDLDPPRPSFGGGLRSSKSSLAG